MALPGIKTTILDRFYNQSRTDLPGGPLITVVGKRGNAATTSAPDLTPYFVTSEQDVIAQFGEDSQLHKAFYELSVSGAASVAVVALPSDTTYNQSLGTLSSASWSGSGTLFDAAMGAVESARADIVVLWGRGADESDWNDHATPATPGDNNTDFFYADNASGPTTSWAAKLAQACLNITLNSHPIIGVIGCSPLDGLEIPTPSEIADHTLLPNLVDRGAISAGHLVNIVCAEVEVLNAPESWGFQNGACSYAAAISRQVSWSATTGKPVFNIDRLRFNPTRSQAEALVAKGVVPIQTDFSRTARWVDGVTFSSNTSDYSRLTTVRIVFDAVKLIRRVAQSYVGETMSVERQQAFQTQISTALQGMQRVGSINNSDFRVTFSPRDNKASVDLVITPAFELREIDIKVSVNF